MLQIFVVVGIGICVQAWPNRFAHQDIVKRSDAALAADVTDDKYLLPKNMMPLQYDLILEPKMYSSNEEDFIFSGYVGIQMRCEKVTEKITLHSKNLQIDASTVKLTRIRTQEDIAITHIEYDTVHEFVHLTVNRSMVEGEKYYLQLSFTGPLLNDLLGLYLSFYNVNYTTGEKEYEAVTQLEPTYARKAFPCFDEPALKALFNVTVIRKEGWIALSNGKKMGETHLGGDSYADHFTMTPLMSTYLVALVVGKYKSLSTVTPKGVEFKVWSRNEINNTQLALRVGSEIQTFFENYLELDYPLVKQDMVVVNHFRALAMENWGLIIYQPYYMLYNESWNHVWSKRSVVETIAHELAHQWFGNIVTLHWWSDTWLNEGFANFFQSIGSGHSFPDWNQRERIADQTVTILGRDTFPNYPPLHEAVSTPHEIEGMFGTISYEKAGSIIHMMEYFLGRETFRKGLVNYMKNKQYSNAVPDDVLYALGNQSISDGHPLDVKGIMDTWIYQNNYPVLMVTQDEKGDIHISQKRFVESNKTGDYPSPFGYKWKIPFTYTDSTERDFNKSHSEVLWIHEQETVLHTAASGKDEWIIGNIQGFGYYAVNYDESNWNRLIEQMKTDREVIHPLNRARLYYEGHNLAYAGQLSEDIKNKLYEVMNGENSFAPLQAAVRQFHHLDNMLSGTEVESDFKTFVQKSIQNQYAKYGYDSTPITMDEVEKKRVLVDAACSFRMPDCTEKAVLGYRNWMNDPDGKAISPDIKKTVFCTAISEGGQEEWDFACDYFGKTNNVYERMNLIEGMACTKMSSVLNSYLTLALKPEEMTVEEASKLVSAVSKNPVGRKMVWNFLDRHWNEIEKRFGKDSRQLEKLIQNLSVSFNTKNDLRQMTKIQSVHQYSVGSPLLSLRQEQDMTQGNIRWMRNNYPVVAKWLKSKNYNRRSL